MNIYALDFTNLLGSNGLIHCTGDYAEQMKDMEERLNHQEEVADQLESAKERLEDQVGQKYFLIFYAGPTARLLNTQVSVSFKSFCYDVDFCWLSERQRKTQLQCCDV